MNFSFLRECGSENPELCKCYSLISEKLVVAENIYWENPQQCGIVLREAAEEICRFYNRYYEVGFQEETKLERFLCYTDEDEHNAMVSRFLSVARREQRDRLIKLRVLGDDCILGTEAPDQGMSFEDRMSQNAKRMMDTMMETIKEMVHRVEGRNDFSGLKFLEEELPGEKPVIVEETELQETKNQTLEKKPGLFGKLFGSSKQMVESES